MINPDQDLAIDGEPGAGLIRLLSKSRLQRMEQPWVAWSYVTATATDDVAVASVEFRIGGSSIGTDGDGSDGWTQLWDTAAGPDGSASITAVATDSAGQTASSAVWRHR